MRSLRSLALLLLASQAACASFSTHLTPRPTEKKQTDVQVNIGVMRTETRTGTLIVPVPEIGIRYGLSDFADIGGKVSLTRAGGEINSRVALVQSEGFDLAIVPGAGLALGSVSSDKETALLTTFSLPILAGLNLGPSTIVFGPKIVGHLGLAADNQAQSSFVLYPGGVIGISLQLGETFSIMPELNVHYPYDVDTSVWSDPIFQGGLSFYFGAL